MLIICIFEEKKFGIVNTWIWCFRQNFPPQSILPYWLRPNKAMLWRDATVLSFLQSQSINDHQQRRWNIDLRYVKKVQAHYFKFYFAQSRWKYANHHKYFLRKQTSWKLLPRKIISTPLTFYGLILGLFDIK